MNEKQIFAADIYVTDIFYVEKFEADVNWHITERAINSQGYILVFCDAGEATYMYNGQTVDISQGDILFLRRDTKRSGRTHLDNPWGFYVICFDLALNPEAGELIDQIQGVIHSDFSQMLSVFREVFHTWNTARIAYKLTIRNLIEKVLLEIIGKHYDFPHDDSTYSCVKTSVYRMEKNPQIDFSVAQFALEYNVSEGHFRRLFKAYTGMSVCDYLRMIRINLAKSYLLYGNYNVAEAAQLTGFSNPFYFSRIFKKQTGISPSEFARNGGKES